MEKKDIPVLSKEAFSRQIDQASHRFSRIDRIQQDPLEPREHLHRFRHLRRRPRVSGADIVIEAQNRVARDRSAADALGGGLDEAVYELFLSVLRSADVDAHDGDITIEAGDEACMIIKGLIWMVSSLLTNMQ